MKKNLLTVIFFSIFILAIGVGCKKTKTDTSVPTVVTRDVMLDVTSTSAQSGGTITGLGGNSVLEDGIVYSETNQQPTTSDTKIAAALISVTYSFVANLASLKPNTVYYVRAYARNEYGTGYGATVKFTTSSTLSSVTGIVTTFAGNGNPGFADGIGAGAQFSNPGGMAIDAQGNIYISDTFNNRIRKMAPDGTVTTIAGNGASGYIDGAAADAEFYAPAGLTLDGQGNIFVADYGNNVIRKVAPDGTVSTYAGNGFAAFVDGAAYKVAAFNGPAGVALDSKGNLFVADQNNNMIRKITPTGGVSLVAGITTGGYVNLQVDSVKAAWGAFSHPCAIAMGPDGNLYIADRGNSAIRMITPGGNITTVAGGPSQTTLIGLPAGLSLDAQGDVFITDESGRVIELTAAKNLYDLAGAPAVYGFADGAGTSAQFNQPQGVAVDASGNIFVADYNNNRIRKVVIQLNDN
jgi:streptogramin lyase